MIKRLKRKMQEIKEAKKEDTWFWFTLGYSVFYLLFILDEWIKIMIGIYR